MYKVIHKFQDLEDENKHIYEVTNKFPYDNREIEESRIADLTTINNKIGVPLIKFEEDKQEDKPKDDVPGTNQEKQPGENNSGTDVKDKPEDNNSDLNGLKQPELKAIAKNLEIQFKAIISNDELIRLIKEKRANQKSNNE
jgi:hypothetical protein